ncbi:MAG: RNA polymerase sigma factor [Calditrichia bacterium]
MQNKSQAEEHLLPEHFFRTEYGRIVAFLTRYVGIGNIADAEDIAQETFLKAVEHWTHNSLPPNPQAWLYTTAKNLMLNALKRKKYLADYVGQYPEDHQLEKGVEFSDDLIQDEQLKMMFACCTDSISEQQQCALILKVLCGFSIAEIAAAFLTSKETINKRLVRARGTLKDDARNFKLPLKVGPSVRIVLRTIYLLFNEGYKSSGNNMFIRRELCLEAIRLAQLLTGNKHVKRKSEPHALLALMFLNVSRFDARQNEVGEIIEMKEQDRSLWNMDLINEGLRHLTCASSEQEVSTYLLLAAISANYCTAATFEETNWQEILELYDRLLQLENSPLVLLNRAVVVSRVHGVGSAIAELRKLEANAAIANNYLFHSTMGELFLQEEDRPSAVVSFKKAISLAPKNPELDVLQKKLRQIVPVC